MNSRFKTPLLFGLIGSSVTFICALIGVIYLANYTNYFEFCETLMAQVLSNGMTVEDMIKEMAPMITESIIPKIVIPPPNATIKLYVHRL